MAVKMSCSNCAHWVAKPGEDLGDCHRYPPSTVRVAPGRPPETDYTITTGNDWCYEFRKK